MRAEMGGDPLIVATGGLAPLIAEASTTVQKVEPYLTLEGLKVIFDQHAARHQQVRT
jgi:type III pantothenate kinase